MKRLRKSLCMTLTALVAWMPVERVIAEDIDLFVGSTGTSANPNILVIIDNSANWSAASQHWPGGIKQGQSELKALRTVISEIRPSDATSSKINLGLMMFTAGQGSDINGTYPRFHVRPMTQTNVDSFMQLIGDPASSCSGYNSLTGAPNCIYHNFDTPFEKTATANTDYSSGLFEAFKYFGGYTDVAHAQSNPAVAGVPPVGAVAPHTFGVTRRSGTIPADTTSDEYKKFDAAAYASSDKSAYNSPISSTNACAKNYIILIGNGFPVKEPNAWDTELLYNVNQSSTQLSMPQFTTATNSVTSIIGTACGTGSNAGQRVTSCLANSTSLQTANPADSYTCINARVEATCTGSSNRLHDVQSTKTVITVTPTGTFATPTASNTRYGDEWAKFLATTDVSDVGGQQTISTYTIDVFKDAQDSNQTALLMSMARYGSGKYFQASSEAAIIDALRNIWIEIQSVNTVFASASLPINATNRSQNENQVFIGMFRPDSGARPRWYGNLKRYQVANFSGNAKLADAAGAEAIGSTGFVAPCATSYWTSDSGTYWNFTQAGVTSFAGLCTTSGTALFSDKADGAQVEKGAVADVLRRGNNPPYADATTTPSPASVNRAMLTCKNDNTSTTFNNSLVTCNTGTTALHALSSTNIADPDALLAADNTERDRIINFARGEDFSSDQTDLNQNGSTTDVRPDVHGDVAHSRPLPLNYGGSTGVVLFYGSNDATFRAVRGSDGKELWAFVAPEHHQKLKRMRDNLPLIKYPNSTDPSHMARDYFFDGTAGAYQTFNSDNTSNTAWIFPSMRRGGRMLYGFNVSDPSNPRMLWRAGCPVNSASDDTGCTTGFSGIGQTWSTPLAAKILGYSSGADPVVIVGGGYDSCEDNDAATTTCSSPKGRNVYVLNASTGAIIKTFGTGGTGTIDRSVAADIALVDRSFTGYAQHAYVSDVGGNLYRIDFVDPATRAARAPADWTITKIARTSGGNRKFLFAPAVLPSNGKVYLTIGTGDRERPLITNYPYVESVQNRFYMFIDAFPSTASTAIDLDGATMNDFTASTSCSSAITTGFNGWRMDLNAGRGEQTVTSSLIAGGLVYFSTNRPLATAVAACTNNLGEARGYAVNLLNASGAVGTDALCGGTRSGIFLGGGLPPSPVLGIVPIAGKPTTVMIGGIDRSGATSSPIGSQKILPVIAQKRTRTYWYRHGDK